MFHQRFRIPYIFSWAPLLVGDTAEVVPSSATSSTEFDSTKLDKIGVPSKIYVAHTDTRTVTELFTYEVLLYSSLYSWEREAHINWSMVTCQGSTRLELVEVYWPCAGGLSAVNAIGTHYLRDPINSAGLARSRMAI